MYIEQLTEKDIKEFAGLFDCGVSNLKKSNENELYIQLFTGAMGPQPEMWLSDFDLRTSTSYKWAEKQLKTRYIHFMNNKFGKEYKAKYTESYNKQVAENRMI